MAALDIDIVLPLDAFTLDVHDRSDARALALVGPSGSGKTSIVEVIAGLRRPAGGRVAVAGRVLFSDALGVDLPPRDRRVGYVPQDVLLFPHLDVLGNLTFARRGRGDRFDEVVEWMDLGSVLARRVTELSGGERQRVAIGRALLSEPDVLLLDEPLSAVDLPRRRRILDVLVEIRDRLPMPIVYVAHSPDEVRAVADRALVIERGRVLAAGHPADVLPW